MMILASVYGRLTKEPEMRTTNNGTQVAGFSIAVNHGKDGQGNYVTAFVDISALGKTAETVMKYLRKGFRVCVFADLRLRRYTTQQGVQGSTLEGTAIRVEFVDSPEQQQPAHSLQRRRRRAVMRPIPVCPRQHPRRIRIMRLPPRRLRPAHIRRLRPGDGRRRGHRRICSHTGRTLGIKTQGLCPR